MASSKKNDKNKAKEASPVGQVSLEDMKKDQLKALLKERDLPVTWRKDELIARLRNPPGRTMASGKKNDKNKTKEASPEG